MAPRKNDVEVFLAESFFHARPTDSKKQCCSAYLGAESCPGIKDLLSICVHMNLGMLSLAFEFRLGLGFLSESPLLLPMFCFTSLSSHGRQKPDSFWLKPNGRCVCVYFNTDANLCLVQGTKMETP